MLYQEIFQITKIFQKNCAPFGLLGFLAAGVKNLSKNYLS